MFGGINENDRKNLILAAMTVGVTIVVYLVFRYILFLVAPFLVGFIMAVLIKKPVYYMKKKFRISPIIGTIVIMIVIICLVAFFLSYVGGRFVYELKNFMVNYDLYYDSMVDGVCSMCGSVDDVLGLSEGKTFEAVERNISNMMTMVSDNVLPSLVQNSANVVSVVIIWGGGIVIAFTAVFFIIKDMDRMSYWVKRGPYNKWFRIMFGRLSHFGAAYIRTQLVIMGITAVICTAALLFIGNGYPVMIGILIGLLDALPLFGTGTVLIPWTVIYLFSGKFLKAAVIFTAYCLCYIIREVLEPKMMGGHMGIHPFIMLITMYVGVLLFGIMGFILGPAAYIIIGEIMKYLRQVI
ncbi:MAG: AI-2E family transporter [Thermoflexaceae bacterium]|nr:AI-2E family transporter [Thermoflexaceae bacterium]